MTFRPVSMIARSLLFSAASLAVVGCGSRAAEQAPPGLPSAAKPSEAAAPAPSTTCDTLGFQFQGELGTTVRVTCPAGCGGTVFGSNPYTADSPVCGAAIHAGAIAATGGVIELRKEVGRPAYRGLVRNGITSRDFGAYARSIVVVNASGGAPKIPEDGLVEAGCSLVGDQLQGEPGTTVRVDCPSGCDARGHAHGSNLYTSDSEVCFAGVHAGAIGVKGGLVEVRKDVGRPAFRGTSRNGVASRDHGPFPRTFAVLNAAGGPPAEPADGAIEIGCSMTDDGLPGDPGAVLRLSCPAGCDSRGETFGSNLYTSDSAVCRAGVHAGAIPAMGGVVELRKESGRVAYRGSTRNGVASRDYGAFARSFVVLNGPDGAPKLAPQDLVEVGCSMRGESLPGDVGTVLHVSCPEGCDSHGGLYGSDVYTGDSAVCRAAIHAGVVSTKGGLVDVRKEAGRKDYAGSQRNGIGSQSYKAHASSFAVLKAKSGAKH